MARGSALALLALGMAVFVAPACGVGPALPQPSPTPPTPVTPFAALSPATPKDVPLEPRAASYKNEPFSYELVVPPGWELDQSDPKGVVLRGPERGFFITVAVYGPEDLPPAPTTLEEYRNAWLALMNRVMPGFTVSKEERGVVGERDALLYQYTWIDRGRKLRAKAMLVHRANYGYELFGWVPEPAWPEFSTAVEDLLRSFKLK